MKIKIGALIYDILFLQDYDFEQSLIKCGAIVGDNRVRAFIAYENASIFVRDSLPISVKKELALHEILHGLIDNTYGAEMLERSSENDVAETFVSLLSPRLHQFLLEPFNQQFLCWFYS